MAATGPSILSVSPSDNATNVAVDANFIITFDKTVRKGSGSPTITIYKASDNTEYESIAVSSSRVSINSASANVVTVNPSKDLALGTAYYITLDPGAFASTDDGGEYTGMMGSAAWNFTTVQFVDQTKPTLSSHAPAQSGTNVSINTTLTLNFSEPVYSDTGTITIRDVTNSNYTQTFAVTSSYVTGISTSSITITPPQGLQSNHTYEILVPSTAFVDASGNRYDGLSTNDWRFVTAGPPIGTPTFLPADNAYAVSVDTNLSLTFAQPVSKGSGYLYIKKIADNSIVQQVSVTSSSVSVSGSTVTWDPSSNLTANTGYYIMVDAGALRDATTASLQYEGILDASVWNFTTGVTSDTTAPTLTDKTPTGTVSTTSVTLTLTFSEPVYQSTGDIVIKTGSTTAASIPVTSSQVSGGGTTTITVKPSAALKLGSTYYVQIGSQAFRDANGNYYAGITSTSAWTFMVSDDTTKPTIVTLSPANNETDVAISGNTLEVTFSEPITLVGDPDTTAKVRRSTTSYMKATIAADSTNNRRLLITPESALTANTNYYIEIAADAVTDLNGNTFDGILNAYQWAFKTGSSSGTPSVTSIAMVGTSKIAITYNQSLDTTSVPSTANFYVTVNSASRAVTGVSVSGKIVYLTLASSVISGQKVRLSYSVGANPIRNLNGSTASTISNETVVNQADATPPTLLSGSVTGNLITLIFSEELQDLSTYAYRQFSVKVASSTRSISTVTGSSNVVLITLTGNDVTAAQTVTVSYSKGSYPLYDLSDNALASFSNYQILNGIDTTAPVLKNASLAGDTITLTYNESLSTSNKPSITAYTVLVDGASRAVTSVTITGYEVKLTLASAASTGQTVKVSYTRKDPYLTDTAGNPAESFANVDASGTTSSTIAVTGAIAKGEKVTVSFSSNLDSSYVPLASQFTVKANSSVRLVSAVEISTSKVTLTLSTPIAIGDTVRLTYNPSTILLRSASGVIADSFTDLAVANQTTWADDPTSDFTASPTGEGIGLKVQTASTSPETSPGGKTINRYSISSGKLKGAFDMLDSLESEPKVFFEVPDTEAAGSVAIPLQTIKDKLIDEPDASFAVVYDDISYEVPFKYVDFTTITSNIASTGSLLITIDSGNNALTAPLTTAISAAGSQLLAGPMNFETYVLYNGKQTKIESFTGYTTRSIATGSTLDTRQTAVVWYDPVTEKLSYAPTHVETTDGESTVTFQRQGNSAYAVIKGNVTYTDLGTHWARNDILLLANKYIVEGRSLTTYAPKASITRAEFAAYISKGLGLSGDKTAAAVFKDVDTNSAAAAYIGAASKAGIINGMTDGTFMPNSPVTREQMATMMIRAAEVAGEKFDLSTNASSLLKRFSDSGKIGSWAQVDVAKAVQLGVINGMSDGTFGAKANATRAEAVLMIKRLLDTLGFLDI